MHLHCTAILHPVSVSAGPRACGSTATAPTAISVHVPVLQQVRVGVSARFVVGLRFYPLALLRSAEIFTLIPLCFDAIIFSPLLCSEAGGDIGKSGLGVQTEP